MVLEIKFKNFFSIKDEISIDFRAAPLNSAPAKALQENTYMCQENKLLKTVVLYGANASGKSNIIKAIRFALALIMESHQHNENTTFNFKPFKFGNSPQEPSCFFIRFTSEGTEYEYSYCLNKERIVKESLHFFPKGRRKEIFSRDENRGDQKKDIYRFGNVIKRPMDVAQNTSTKTLFLSRASQMDREIPKSLFHYFSSNFTLKYHDYGMEAVRALKGTAKAPLLEALKIADSDLIDVEVAVVYGTSRPGYSPYTEGITSMVMENNDPEQLRITTYHKKDPTRGFDFFTEESAGTQKLFFMMLTILDVVQHQKCMLVDEIEDSLHPKILDYIFRCFHAGDGAQLLCTTHNTHFLDLKKLRKDQIYFVDKQEDASTDLYSLYDFKDFRENMDLEKAYLQGRFDAIPYLNDDKQQIMALINGTKEEAESR